MTFDRALILWLCSGLVLVYFQIIIGGITRLTGSGLSITQWEIVTGTLPPMSVERWNEEFEEYKGTPQYEKLNRGMTLKEFKFIYFWEYFHRLWARLMGFVFIIPFCIFYVKRKIPKKTLRDLGVVVFLAALAASFGWIMVASGLVDRPWVNAYKLSIHLLLGIAVFVYLLWTLLKYMNGNGKQVTKSGSSGWLKLLLILIFVQIVFGGWMSGMKAALIYPTWPDIGGQIIPRDLLRTSNWTLDNFVNYDNSPFVFGVVQFVHRGLAYIIIVVSFYYAWRSGWWKAKKKLRTTYGWFLLALVTQVIIGILTLVKSVGQVPLFFGVLHQAVAVFVVGLLTVHLFYRSGHIDKL